jgi:hypothetical protein
VHCICLLLTQSGPTDFPRAPRLQYLNGGPARLAVFLAATTGKRTRPTTIGKSEGNGSNPNTRRALDIQEGKPMPWTSEDAERHTKKADNAKRQRMWADIANSVLAETGEKGRAIREANAMVGRDHEKSAGSS